MTLDGTPCGSNPAIRITSCPEYSHVPRLGTRNYLGRICPKRLEDMGDE